MSVLETGFDLICLPCSEPAIRTKIQATGRVLPLCVGEYSTLSPWSLHRHFCPAISQPDAYICLGLFLLSSLAVLFSSSLHLVPLGLCCLLKNLSSLHRLLRREKGKKKKRRRSRPGTSRHVQIVEQTACTCRPGGNTSSYTATPTPTPTAPEASPPAAAARAAASPRDIIHTALSRPQACVSHRRNHHHTTTGGSRRSSSFGTASPATGLHPHPRSRQLRENRVTTVDASYRRAG